MRKFPQSMVNIRTTNATELTKNKAVQLAIADIETRLGENGRVLLRPSGTEPVLRVMVEGEDSKTVDQLAKELSELVASETSS
jgi:phosphoglucosamine mutase